MSRVHERVERDGLTAEVRVGPDVVIHMDGVIREQNPEDWMEPLLRRVGFMNGAGAKVVLDLRQVSYMNATAFRVILAWLGTLGTLDPPCRLTVWANEEHLWQRVGISTLKVVGGDLVTVENGPPNAAGVAHFRAARSSLS